MPTDHARPTLDDLVTKLRPQLRNTGSLALRRNDGCGVSTLARLWIDT